MPGGCEFDILLQEDATKLVCKDGMARDPVYSRVVVCGFGN